MIKLASTAWKNTFSTLTQDTRIYIDPRGVDYPPVSGTPAYTAITSAQNAPGSYSLTSALTYFFQPSTSFTIEAYVRQNHTSGTASNIFRFLGGDAITLAWSTSGYYALTDRSAHTITGGSYSTAYNRLTAVFTYGGTMQFYIDGTSIGSATAAALSLNDVMLEINGSANSYINYVRIFNGYSATATDVANNFRDVKYEEIYFDFNKNPTGRTRCNVTDYGYEYNIGPRKGGYESCPASVSLRNISGEFCDDQYATFQPQSGSYNGTSSQSYLKRKMRLEIESWYATGTELFEPIYQGFIPSGSFIRSTDPGGISNITVGAKDFLSELARKKTRKNRVFDSYYLSQNSGTSSVFHEVAQLGTKKEIYTYATNSSFENSTLGNSWQASGGTFTRGTGNPLIGTYCGTFTGTGLQTISQFVIFSDLSAGEKLSASIYLYYTSSLGLTFRIREYDGATLGDYTDYNTNHSGKGWDKISVSHTITNSSSDRISIILFVNTATNLYLDCAMLKYGDDMPWFILNSNDGSSGVSAIGSETLGTYDLIGINADDVTSIGTHPWSVIEREKSILSILGQVADACIARKMYISPDGLLTMTSAFTSALPTSLGTISKPTSVSTGQQDLTANKLLVQGVHIEEKASVECLWQISASGLQSSNTNSSTDWYRTMGNGDTLPMAAYDGVDELECIYSSATETASSIQKEWQDFKLPYIRIT